MNPAQKKTFWRKLTRLHKWSGLILGIQITLWFASGFFMTLFPIETVRGNHVAQKQNFDLLSTNVIPIARLAVEHTQSVTLRSVAGTPVYVVNNKHYYDALTGQDWTGASEDHVRIALSRYYRGTGQMTQLNKIDIAPIEYRGPLPVWQAQFDDSSKTRLYVNAQTADLAAIRTRVWRVFDFMWMLHIMDYKSRDNFNTIWLRLFSGAALLFALSGMALVAHRIILRPRPKKPRQTRS